MKFNPEDGQLTGPRCRNCHKGSGGCGGCHNTDPGAEGVNSDAANKNELGAANGRQAITYLFAAMFDLGHAADPTGAGFANWGGFNENIANMNVPGWAQDTSATPWEGMFAPVTPYETSHTSNGLANDIASSITTVTVSPGSNGYRIMNQIKNSRTASWSQNWRMLTDSVSMGSVGTSISTTGTLGATANCSDDGFSFPHRTLGWKMLKDDLFGLDFDGSTINVGEYRYNTIAKLGGNAKPAGYSKTDGKVNGIGAVVGLKAHDVDSVCLDCHNPTVWRATDARNHDDTGGNTIYNDDVILRGLP